jgi:uncharacterized protein (TIGR02594 family)
MQKNQIVIMEIRSPLPNNFAWINDVMDAAGGKPLMLAESLKEYGVHRGIDMAHDKQGNDLAHSNPEIIGWAHEIGGNVEHVYLTDSISWCGLYMAVIAQRAGKQLPVSPLWALNWGTFGTYVETPMLGDVLVFVRHTPDGKRAGHVSQYVAETKDTYWILGGNQGSCVCIEEIAKDRLYTSRRPVYAVGLPASVKQYFMDSGGNLATNEQ